MGTIRESVRSYFICSKLHNIEDNRYISAEIEGSIITKFEAVLKLYSTSNRFKLLQVIAADAAKAK